MNLSSNINQLRHGKVIECDYDEHISKEEYNDN